MPHDKMFSNIQVLRGFAAIAVVTFHTVLTASKYQFPPDLLSVLSEWGKNGVDVFFVISGFIMVYIQTVKRDTPLKFLTHRIVRIVPLYWTLTLGLVFLYLLIPGVFNEMKMTSSWALSSFFFISGPFYNTYPVLYLGWTLEYEMLFYVVFAVGVVVECT